MSPRNIISCVVGIYIFGFKKYLQRVFNFDGDQNNINLQIVLENLKRSKLIKTSNTINNTMLNTESLP